MYTNNIQSYACNIWCYNEQCNRTQRSTQISGFYSLMLKWPKTGLNLGLDL